MKLSEIDATLREIRVSPIKTLGQNFLHDRNLARWIIERAELTADDFVIEIGPGLGALTEFILAARARLLAIEKDRRLADFLRTRFATERLEILHADALHYDVRKLFAWPRVKLIGNLPYYISSRLLLQFTKYPSPINLWLLMLQKEVARRISAAPGSEDYGSLSLMVQLHYGVEYLRTVPASVFLPRPDVDSAFVRITPRTDDELPDCDAEIFARLVRRGFSQRRKQLRKLLREDVNDWDAAATVVGCEPRARAEELSLLQWIALANFVAPIHNAGEIATTSELFPVVDENDHFLRAAPREEVHGNNLRHRAVHILIFNTRGEIFLQKRSRWKDRHPRLWDSSAAGHVAVDEGYDAAALRELDEELGVTAALTRIGQLPPSEKTGQEFISIYRAQHDGPFRLARSEIECGEFFPTGIVAPWIRARPGDFAPGFLECWRELQPVA